MNDALCNQRSTSTLLACSGLALLVAGDAPLVRLFGRLHPLLVHFPIALLLVAAALTFFGRREKWANAASVCLAFGALGAVAAASTGWINAANESQPRSLESTLFWHRWCGVATATLACLAWYGARPTTRFALARQAAKPALLAAIATLVWGAHQGGVLVYGEGYYLEVFERAAPPQVPEPSAPIVPEPVPEPVPGSGSVPVSVPEVIAGVDFAHDVAPIISGRCIQCHGPTKKKGNLRLDQREFVLGGDKREWLVVPGDPEASELVRLISLPGDDEDRMPGEGDPLTAEQIATLREWIQAGAVWPEGFVVPPPANTESGAAPVGATGTVASTVPELDAAAQGALTRLRSLGAHAAPIAQGTSEVEVNLALVGGGADDATLGMLKGLEQQLVGLDLARTKTSDAGLAQLARFTSLRRLHLEGTQVGDAGLAHLGGLARLEYLNLWGTKTSDAGLEHLTDLKALRHLYLWRTQTSAEGVARLREALPELTVVTGDELQPPTPEPEPAQAATEPLPPCCAAARAAGGECDHPCCIEARAAGKLCPRCKA